ncbi:DUF4374 domain-containing protein [Salinimicrobium sp. TH3]|uniref:DUF4374 domain-containing protein n=1 Tax=Salinimicrobium sp. TH3 TaxID=2997342 RepID=UPI00227513FA|nr:DUF4374 domain-containing protein [Salinimicrobium sp. TH3]MCY2687523.1 DUF4374 domain-containing protein [Salinimicrobium sp. TH3]
MLSIKKVAIPVLGLFTGLLFSSCSTDDAEENPNPQPTDEPYVLSLAIQGSEGNFTYYTVPFEDVMTGSLSAEGRGIEQPGYFDFKQIDNTIYSIGGLDDVNVVGITKNAEGELVQTGDVSFTNSLSDIVKADDNTLVAVTLSANSDMVTFHTLDENDVNVISTVTRPISDLTDVDVPSYSGMRIEDGHLFLSYYISDPNTYATNYTDVAQVAVYSYPGFEFQKVITDDRVGPIGGFNVKSGLIEDENGNIFAVSHSNPANGYSQFTNDSGILKINSGETTFDLDYFFDVQEVAGGNPVHLIYLGNGKAFAEINMAARDQQAVWSDSPLQSAIIDLNNKTVNFITGIPEHNGSGRRLAALQDGNYLYLTIPGEQGVSVYRVDTTNYTATKGADVEANFVAGFFKI